MICRADDRAARRHFRAGGHALARHVHQEGRSADRGRPARPRPALPHAGLLPLLSVLLALPHAADVLCRATPGTSAPAASRIASLS